MKTLSIALGLVATTATVATNVRVEPAPTKRDCFDQFLKSAAEIPGAVNAGTIDLGSSPEIKQANAALMECDRLSNTNALRLTIR